MDRPGELQLVTLQHLKKQPTHLHCRVRFSYNDIRLTRSLLGYSQSSNPMSKIEAHRITGGDDHSNESFEVQIEIEMGQTPGAPP